jgi:hypothetical protein
MATECAINGINKLLHAMAFKYSAPKLRNMEKALTNGFDSVPEIQTPVPYNF